MNGLMATIARYKMAEMILIGFDSNGTPNSKRIDLTGKTAEQIKEEMTK